MELIDKYEFIRVVRNESFERFVVYVSSLATPEPAIHPSQALLLAVL